MTCTTSMSFLLKKLLVSHSSFSVPEGLYRNVVVRASFHHAGEGNTQGITIGTTWGCSKAEPLPYLRSLLAQTFHVREKETYAV